MSRPIFGFPTTGRMLAECRVEAHSDGYSLHTPYDQAFVMALKANVPATDRKWDKQLSAWIVSHSHGKTAQQLIAQYYGVHVELPLILSVTQISEMRILDVRYIGATKAREDGNETAFAWCDGGWNVIFSREILQQWFEGSEQRPGAANTLYAVLTVSQESTPDEIKKAYRRLARQWHPDVCREPDAREQFEAIQAAYEILSSEKKRARYNAGLQLEAQAIGHQAKPRYPQDNYRSPLRCGLILVEGSSRLGRFIVSKVLQWQDLVDSSGRVLVTSWQMGDTHFTESWVEA